MSIMLFSHSRRAYDAVTVMLAKASKAAAFHPAGTGKSIFAFKRIEQNAKKRFVRFPTGAGIYNTQIGNVTRTGPVFPSERITFLTCTRLMPMKDGEIAALCPRGIILNPFRRCGAKGGSVVRLPGYAAAECRYPDGQRDMAKEPFEGCVASRMALGEAVERNMLSAPTGMTTVFRIQRELEGFQKRINAVSPAVLRRDNRRHMEALRETVENAEGLPAVFVCHGADKRGEHRSAGRKTKRPTWAGCQSAIKLSRRRQAGYGTLVMKAGSEAMQRPMCILKSI